MFQNLGSSDLVSKLASATGGGALLGLAMLDVLPELRERIDSDTEYPLAEVLMIASTFLVAIVDNLIRRCFMKGHAHSHERKRRLESRAELLSENPTDDVDEESHTTSEISSMKFSIDRTEEYSRHSNKVTKLIIGLSLHSCTYKNPKKS